MRIPRWVKWTAGTLVGIVVAAQVAYRVADPETKSLTDADRTGVAGAFVRLGDGVTHYELAGPDTAHLVVLAAGASVPHYIWDSTFHALTQAGFRVLRYTYYGRGWSDRPDIAYTPDLYVRQLSQLLDTLHVTTPIDLAGLSFGGSVITSFASAHPQRVRSLIYVDPYIRARRTPPAWQRSFFLVDRLMLFASSPTMASGQLKDFLHPERWPDWPDRYRVQMSFKGFRRARVSEAIANADLDQAAELAEVGAHPRPVLVIWGRQDRTVPFSFSERMMKAMPRARLLAVDSGAHLPHMEQSGLVQPSIMEFLRRVP